MVDSWCCCRGCFSHEQLQSTTAIIIGDLGEWIVDGKQRLGFVGFLCCLPCNLDFLAALFIFFRLLLSFCLCLFLFFLVLIFLILRLFTLWFFFLVGAAVVFSSFLVLVVLEEWFRRLPFCVSLVILQS